MNLLNVFLAWLAKLSLSLLLPFRGLQSLQVWSFVISECLDSLYFSFFSASFCVPFLPAGTAISISMYAFCFLFVFNYSVWPVDLIIIIIISALPRVISHRRCFTCGMAFSLHWNICPYHGSSFTILTAYLPRVGVSPSPSNGSSLNFSPYSNNCAS